MKQVEVARGVRLCQATIEPFTLRVPRVKVDMCLCACGVLYMRVVVVCV